jgi:hypothetical protein
VYPWLRQDFADVVAALRLDGASGAQKFPQSWSELLLRVAGKHWGLIDDLPAVVALHDSERLVAA